MNGDYIESLVMALGDNILPQAKTNAYKEMCHGIAVSNCAYEVARHMDKSDKFCKNIMIAGLLHDIGKLRLNKYMDNVYRDSLVVEQISHVRQHTLYSMLILAQKHYPLEICEAVFYHHENCDGSGYPYGVTAERIPTMSKILRVCDVFAALTTDRPYRSGFELETAMEMMIGEISNYDMEVFLAFQRFYHSSRFEELSPLRVEINDIQRTHLKRFIEEMERKTDI